MLTPSKRHPSCTCPKGGLAEFPECAVSRVSRRHNGDGLRMLEGRRSQSRSRRYLGKEARGQIKKYLQGDAAGPAASGTSQMQGEPINPPRDLQKLFDP